MINYLGYIYIYIYIYTYIFVYNFIIILLLNQLVEFEISATAYIIGESLVAYQIGYVSDRCPPRQFQTLISQVNAN